LLHEARGCPFLPGASTPSEVMAVREAGYSTLKFFPAAAAGGVAMLRSLTGPFPDARFCPTGGIDAASAADYLALPNFVCVGGSWLAPRALLQAGDWAGVSRLAAQAAALSR
ncbi:MAG: keto-hydroxyglutarate-aldolase/keto-deoxy-phosphogluconate aldolase, partial [Gammaproteobacteria bacterium]